MYLKTIILCAFIVLNSLVESAREERPKVRYLYNIILLLLFLNTNLIGINHYLKNVFRTLFFVYIGTWKQ